MLSNFTDREIKKKKLPTCTTVLELQGQGHSQGGGGGGGGVLWVLKNPPQRKKGPPKGPLGCTKLKDPPLQSA